MGGQNRKDYRFVPKGVGSIEDLAEGVGIVERDVGKISEHLHKLSLIK